MNLQDIANTAKAQVADEKGLLAMDEAMRHCKEGIGVCNGQAAIRIKNPYNNHVGNQELEADS